MFNIKSATCCIAVSGLLTACASPQELASQKDDLLAAAGFTILPANTDQRRAELLSLPPNRIVQQNSHDRVVFLYADPYACDCLYIGNQKAWDQYRRQRFQQNLAREQEMTAQLNENASWNWQPWGPGWWWGVGP
jgi:hypothetical protein